MAEQKSKLQEKINFYLTIGVFALLIVVPPVLCSLFYLSRVPDVSWGDGSPTYTRIWMHRERRPVGIGYESRRIFVQYSETEICVENKLRFFLWGTSYRTRPATSHTTMVLVNNHWQQTGQVCR